MKEIHHLPIILLYFIIIGALEAISVFCIHVVRILYNGMLWISSWLGTQWHHIWYLEIIGGSVYTLAIGKPCKSGIPLTSKLVVKHLPAEYWDQSF